MPAYMAQLDDEDDPLRELYAQLGQRGPTGATPAAVQAQQPGVSAAPVDEQALSEGARNFYDPNFVNAGRLVEANKGQGAKMAHDVAGGVAAKGAAAKGALDSAQQGFNQGVSSDRPAFDYGTGEPTSGRSSLSGTGGGKGATAQSSPYAYARGASTAAAGPQVGQSTPPVASTSTGPYSGAESLLEQTPSLQEQAKKAAGEASQLGNDVTRRNSMRDFYGSGSSYYGTTGAGLDSFLAGAEGHGELAQVQKEYGGLEDMVTKANEQSIADVGARRSRDEAVTSAGPRNPDDQALRDQALKDLEAEKRSAGIRDEVSRSYLSGYKRGAWGQVDPFGNGDARRFIGQMRTISPDMTEDQMRSLYDGMSDDEYREYRWMMEGSGGRQISGGAFSQPHPDMVGKETLADRQAVVRAFLDRISSGR